VYDAAYVKTKQDRKQFYVEVPDGVDNSVFTSILQQVKQQEEEMKKQAVAESKVAGPTGSTGNLGQTFYNTYATSDTWTLVGSAAACNTAPASVYVPLTTTGYVTTTCGTLAAPAYTFADPTIGTTGTQFYTTYADPTTYTATATIGWGSSDTILKSDWTLKQTKGTPAESRTEEYNGWTYKADSELLMWTYKNAIAGRFEFEVFTEDGMMDAAMIDYVCPAKAEIKMIDGNIIHKSFVLLPTKRLADCADKPGFDFGTMWVDNTIPQLVGKNWQQQEEVEVMFSYAFVVNLEKGDFEVRKMKSLNDLDKAIDSL
jgi:hypothetical protein